MKAQVKDYQVQVRSKVWLEAHGRPVLGPGRREILRAVDEEGSISQAARRLKITFRKAWGQIKAMEEQLGLSVRGEANRGQRGRRGPPHPRSQGPPFQV